MNNAELLGCENEENTFELGDGQIWENDSYVFKIETIGIDFRAIMFKKEKAGLRFLNVSYDGVGARVLNLIKKSKLTLVKKKLSIAEAVPMGDGQLYSNGKSVIQIEEVKNPGYKAVTFDVGEQGLTFSSAFESNASGLKKHLDDNGFTLTNKVITITED